MKKQTPKKLRKRDVLIFAVILALILLIVFGAAKLIEKSNGSKHRNDSDIDSQADDEPGELEIPEDEGRPDGAVDEADLTTWKADGSYDNNIKNILLIGVDRPVLEEQDIYRVAGQSDVIMVLSMNMKTKEYFLISINRDLAVPVENYSYIGESYGFVTEQIALAYSYGDGTRQSGRNVLKSVKLLLGDDVPFLGFIAAPFSVVSTLADAVDGVPVLIEDDFSGVDDTFVMGETVVLRGEHAETFCRARKNMKTSYYNENRMTRQIAFCESFIQKAKETMTAKELVNLYDDMMDTTISDMGKQDITKWILNAYDYTFKGFYRIDGEYGEDMHDAPTMVVDEDAVRELVTSLYYK